MESQNDFKIGDLVWAKMKYYPFWPAKIASPPTVKGKAHTAKEMQKKKSSLPRKAQHYVLFFGSENYARILDKNIVPHSEEMLNEVTTKKCGSYSKAIDEIIEASASIALNHKHEKKRKNMQKPSGSSDDFSAGTSSTPSLQISYRKPIDFKPVDVSTTVKEKCMKMKIGFIGLGMLGRRMVKDLLEAGHNVSVWNRTLEKCKEFVDAGAHQFPSPAELVVKCDIIFCLVSGLEAVHSISLGNGGILQGLEKCEFGTKAYVELTSIDLATSQGICKAITDIGGKYLAAPVRGPSYLPLDREIKVVSAGDVELFEICKHFFSVICYNKTPLYLGPDLREIWRFFSFTRILMEIVYADIIEEVEEKYLKKYFFRVP